MKSKLLLIKTSIVFVLLLCFMINVSGVEAATSESMPVPKNEIYGAYRNYLGEVGFFNYYGSLVKSPQFDLLWQWDEEVILLRENGRYGALNYFGTPVVSFKYEFLERPSNGTIVYATDIQAKGPKYYGLIDTKGKLIVEAQFDAVEKLPNGGIITMIEYPEGKKYGVVFKNKINIKPSFDEVVAYNERFVIFKNSIEGLPVYGFISDNGTRSGMKYSNMTITEDGNYVISERFIGSKKIVELLDKYSAEVKREEFAYLSPKGFTDNNGFDKYFTAVRTYKNGVINESLDLLTISGALKGYQLKKVDYTQVLGQHYRITDMNGHVGLVNGFGNIVISPHFTEITSNTSKYFVGRTVDGVGVFNKQGEDILSISAYDQIDITEDNYFIAKKGKQFSVYNEKGYLQFKFQGEQLMGLGRERFVTVHESGHMDEKGEQKSYYNLVDKEGEPLAKENQYVYMAVIGENRIAIGKDKDGRGFYPSGSVEFIRAPFADIYGIVDFNGKEITPVIYKNLSTYARGVAFCQREEEDFLEAINLDGKVINPEPIESFDPFNRGVVTLAPYEKVRHSGYLNSEGQFHRLVFTFNVDDMIIDQRIEIDGPVAHIIETKTTLYSKEVVDNIVDETILNDYIVTKHRFRDDIIILKDKKWYLDK